MNAIQYIIENKVLPEQISYDEKNIIIADGMNNFYFPVENPRLEFAKCLGCFEEPLLAAYSIADTAKIGINCMIGGSGFGYARSEDGSLTRIPHLGNVIIGGNVIIHNNVNIDRGIIGDTVIGEGTVIDSLVHVAHNVKIGKNCIIVAHANIGGSVEIGDNTWVGMSACIKQHVKIGSNVVIGMGAVVTKDVPDGEVWVGNPAKFMKKSDVK